MKSDKQRAREYGTTVRKLREVEAGLRAIPMDLFLDRLFGPGKAVYDPGTDLWIVADPKYKGPGFGFIAVRRDKTWFCGVVQPDALQ